MIITLKGADFSASNIGTLSTWRITRSLGTGATYDGVTSVDKGASFTATVTIAEGYELGAAGVTVTMGGTAISAATVNGNVISITIAEVTGNVVIKVPTVNTNTGEEDDPDTPEVLLDTYTLDVTKIPSGTDYLVTDPYKSEIFEVTTRRWLGSTAPNIGCYELSTFPYNGSEYILARIDFTKFKNAGYTSVKITQGANASVTSAYYVTSPTYENTWINKTARSTVSNGSVTFNLSDVTIAYLGIRKIDSAGKATNYYGDTFTVKFTK